MFPEHAFTQSALLSCLPFRFMTFELELAHHPLGLVVLFILSVLLILFRLL